MLVDDNQGGPLLFQMRDSIEAQNWLLLLCGSTGLEFREAQISSKSPTPLQFPNAYL